MFHLLVFHAGVFPNSENTKNSQRVKRQAGGNAAPDPNDIMAQVGNYRHDNKIVFSNFIKLFTFLHF